MDEDINYKFHFTHTENQHLVDLFIKKKHILRAEYEVLGTYNLINSIWIWAWNTNQIEKKLTLYSSQIKSYSENLTEKNTNSNPKIEELIYYGTTGSMFISYKNLEKFLKFCKIVINKNNIIPHTIEPNNPKIIEYIIIKNIIQEKSI